MSKLYSSGCPKCKVIEQKLKLKNISFEIITDSNKILEASDKSNIRTAPIFYNEEEDRYLDFSETNK